VPVLGPPVTAVRTSFLAAVDEMLAAGGLGRDMLAYERGEWGGRWSLAEGFAGYVAWLLERSQEDAPRPEGWVPDSTWWWIDGDDYLGSVNVRHRLTDHLRRVGGHIGYLVRPSARRRGHATAMLAAVLPHAHALGIDPALLTCDVDNVASRKVIESNGGVLQDQLDGKLRFWVPTGGGQGTNR
jgi:predicted acetyltransferase